MAKKDIYVVAYDDFDGIHRQHAEKGIDATLGRIRLTIKHGLNGDSHIVLIPENCKLTEEDGEFRSAVDITLEEINELIPLGTNRTLDRVLIPDKVFGIIYRNFKEMMG